MLNIIDEFTRECLAIRVNRKLNSTDVIGVLSDLLDRPRRRTFTAQDNDLPKIDHYPDGQTLPTPKSIRRFTVCVLLADGICKQHAGCAAD
jgi:hypothetical protein